MVQNSGEVRHMEDTLVRDAPADFERNLRIVEALYEEAVMLGVMPRADPLDGIETIIRVARSVNRVR